MATFWLPSVLFLPPLYLFEVMEIVGFLFTPPPPWHLATLSRQLLSRILDSPRDVLSSTLSFLLNCNFPSSAGELSMIQRLFSCGFLEVLFAFHFQSRSDERAFQVDYELEDFCRSPWPQISFLAFSLWGGNLITPGESELSSTDSFSSPPPLLNWQETGISWRPPCSFMGVALCDRRQRIPPGCKNVW